MMGRVIALTVAMGFAAHADVVLYTVTDSGVATAAGSTYNFGTVAQGASKTTRIRARNDSAATAVQVVVLGVSGTGFAVSGAPSIPWVIAPGSAQDFNLVFTAGTGASYSGNLQINSVSLILLASSSPAPVFTVLPGCTGTTASAGATFSGSVDFGPVPLGQVRECDLKVQNAGASPLTVATLTVAGTGFQGPVGLAVPLTLAPQQAFTFSINLTASQPGVITGTLTTDTGRYQLTATAIAPPLPLPALSFDTSIPRSGEQHTLSIRLAAPAQLDTAGFVNLAFVPDTTLVSGDPAVVFVVTSTRTLPFAVKTGSTQVLIGGAAGAVFQTGTTAGRMRFTISGVAQGVDGDPTTELRIVPATVSITSASLTARPGDLDLQIIGFDNTYSAGAMSFTFHDGSGDAIDPGTIQADFTASFRTYFSTSTAGSAFQMLVTFPASGAIATIASLDVTLTNAAGSATATKLALK